MGTPRPLDELPPHKIEPDTDHDDDDGGNDGEPVDDPDEDEE